MSHASTVSGFTPHASQHYESYDLSGQLAHAELHLLVSAETWDWENVPTDRT